MTEISTSNAGFRLGDEGDGVVDIRARLAHLELVVAEVPQPRVFDADLDRAVREFQQGRGLLVDGVVGPKTYRALDEARWKLGDRLLVFIAGSVLAGDDVLGLQQRLLDLGFKVGRVDGRFGPQTERAVKEFQRNVGIPADGTCGPATLKALSRLAPLVTGGRPNAMRAEERLRRDGPQLVGKVVVIDPGTSHVEDPELRALADRVTYDLAKRVEGRLVATGVQAYLTHRGDTDLEEEERAEFANRTNAHLTIALRVDTSENPGASGVSTYFYGIEAHGVRSSVGERFAGLVQREIVARTDLADLRTHARSWDILRRTAMPAVVIDAGYITNPGDAERLADPAFRDVLAEAVVVAVQRVYLTPETDAHTGVLRLSELRAQLRP
ncbi:MAG TPA: N-acetylmuramoyl-L-alanine amidase [Nocardioidaceae bacterium]|nr:N-acetylmuramoyl-L-alanine amidase [Nocardioidaceae bacterium]